MIPPLDWDAFYAAPDVQGRGLKETLLSIFQIRPPSKASLLELKGRILLAVHDVFELIKIKGIWGAFKELCCPPRWEPVVIVGSHHARVPTCTSHHAYRV